MNIDILFGANKVYLQNIYFFFMKVRLLKYLTGGDRRGGRLQFCLQKCDEIVPPLFLCVFKHTLYILYKYNIYIFKYTGRNYFFNFYIQILIYFCLAKISKTKDALFNIKAD